MPSLQGDEANTTNERTPLSAYFAEYGPPGFSFQPNASAHANFNRLCKARNWDERERQPARDRLCEVLVIEFGLIFRGRSDTLAAHQKLCSVLKINPIPGDIGSCVQAVGNVQVNIFDLIEAMITGKPVRKFNSLKELAKYTKRTKKVFPKDKAHKSRLLEELLREIASVPGKGGKKRKRNRKKAQEGNSAGQ
ncbi:hypothetical protein F5I97DRAFT_246183 [Phlebopus sp. FC_14]|nr:hypothetical protein F5I97DRAFT_246183 [Phlebopus sp. FC_14]